MTPHYINVPKILLILQICHNHILPLSGRAIQDASPSVPNFPRTVPRTHSLTQHPPGQLPPPTQQPPPPPSMPELISAAQQQRLANEGHLGNEYQSTNVTANMVPSNSTDR